ncbi:MAG TPA: hypothetical protein VLC93_04800 [Myxococcota bacterium]|nr:hypothetical protein [Myxococcota bacterium]
MLQPSPPWPPSVPKWKARRTSPPGGAGRLTMVRMKPSELPVQARLPAKGFEPALTSLSL